MIDDFAEAQHSTAQHSTAQHSTAQHSTAQHSTAQHSTAQYSTEIFLNKLNSYPKAIKKMTKIWHFRELFNFYSILDHYKVRTRTNFENSNGKSLDLHLLM